MSLPLTEYYKKILKGNSSNHLDMKSVFESYLELNIDGIRHFIEDTLAEHIHEIGSSVLGEKSIYDFVRWSSERMYPLDWRLTLYFLDYISAMESRSVAVAERCIASAASQWTYFEKGDSQCIAIFTSRLGGRLCFAARSKSVFEPRRVYFVEDAPVTSAKITYTELKVEPNELDDFDMKSLIEL